MAATLTTTRTTEFACGCTGTYEGPLGTLVEMAQCERHTPAWKREGFNPASRDLARKPAQCDDAALAVLARQLGVIAGR